LREIYGKTSLIECEIVMYASDKIVDTYILESMK